MQTIAAVSTPIGMGAIGIVRMSGDACLAIALAHFRSHAMPSVPVPNYMYLGHFEGEGFCEQCLMVYFAAPRSYTGEDVVEFQIHGGPTVTDLVLRTLLQSGAAMAHAGEFTRRAYLNGKVTLSEAEGIAAVIGAESRAELNAACQMMQGSLGARLAPTLAALTSLIATLEAGLDYPDEMREEIERDFEPSIRAIADDLSALSATAADGKLVRHGISVALVGTPNAGKSSLLNCILHEERAIVTPIAGTTRDTLCESVSVGGVRLNLLDTAGLREADDLVERMGVERAYRAADRADAVVYLLDATRAERPDPALEQRFASKHLFIVYNKTDVVPAPNAEYPAISAKTGAGVDALLTSLAAILRTDRAYGGLLCEDRHIEAVNRALTYVNRAAEAYRTMPLDCVLVDLSEAYRALGEVDGATATEQVLDSVFRTFCVGK